LGRGGENIKGNNVNGKEAGEEVKLYWAYEDRGEA